MNRVQRLLASVAAALLTSGGASASTVSAWNEAVMKDTLEAYAEFAMNYPDSKLADLAYRKLSGADLDTFAMNAAPSAGVAGSATDDNVASDPDFAPGWVRLI